MSKATIERSCAINPEKRRRARLTGRTRSNVESDGPRARRANQIKWDQDGSLTYRRSCAHGICGSDAMRINGVNRLACKVLMRDVGERVTVEPIMGFRVIKDLVVDMEPFFAQLPLGHART